MTNGFVNHLEKVWKEIEKDYGKNRINSEHALQCDMYKLLREYTDKEKLIILVEPSIFVKGKERFSPDLVIIKNKSIEYIIELKYAQPKKYVGYNPDWAKFNWLQKETEVKVKRNKYTKLGEEKFYVKDVKYFIFAYIDNPPIIGVSDGHRVFDGAINSNEKVLKYINSRKSHAWMKKKYIQFHGHIPRENNEPDSWGQTYSSKKVVF